MLAALSFVVLVASSMNLASASRLAGIRPAFAAGLPVRSSLRPSVTRTPHTLSWTPSLQAGQERAEGAFKGPRTLSRNSVKRTLEFTRMEMSSSEVSAPPMEEEVDPGDIEGTDLRVLKYPHPKLRALDEEVTVFDDALKQVGINKRIMVFNPEGDPKKWPKEVTLINPNIVKVSDATDVEKEGCLSFPGMDGEVQRHKWVQVEAQDLKGKKIKKKYEGWEARVFQHEFDHLNGKMYIDRLSEEERARVQPVLDGLAQKYKEESGEDGVL